MAGSSLVLTDDSVLSRIDQKLYRVEGVLALVSGLAVFSLMILAVVSVSGRNFANQPLPGYIDWIEQVMPLIAFMGIAFTQRDGGHIRMDMLVGALRGRSLYLVELITTLIILALMLLLVWGSWAHFDRSFDFAAQCGAATARSIFRCRCGLQSCWRLSHSRSCACAFCCKSGPIHAHLLPERHPPSPCR